MKTLSRTVGAGPCIVSPGKLTWGILFAWSNPMPDYAKLYRHLFNSQTDAVKILQKAQQEAEEVYYFGHIF